jgi:radical SAM-linked protein
MRVRFRFSKRGKIRFTSHRDVARQWERALRRASLPVASTEGFSPRPKMHFGLALSTGHESWGEYIDVDFLEPEAEDLDLHDLPGRLSALLPVGLEVDTAAVTDRSGLSLQEAVTSCSWRIEVSPECPPAAEDLTAAVAAMLAADHVLVTRERKGKPVSDDLRPAVVGMRVAHDLSHRPSGPPVLEAELATQPRGVRPSELLAALSTFLPDRAPAPGSAGADGARTQPLDEGRVCRTHQWIVLDGARQEPLPPGATRAPHAEARAS